MYVLCLLRYCPILSISNPTATLLSIEHKQRFYILPRYFLVGNIRGVPCGELKDDARLLGSQLGLKTHLNSSYFRKAYQYRIIPIITARTSLDTMVPYRYTDIIVEVKGQIGIIKVNHISTLMSIFHRLTTFSSIDQSLSTLLEGISFWILCTRCENWMRIQQLSSRS